MISQYHLSSSSAYSNAGNSNLKNGILYGDRPRASTTNPFEFLGDLDEAGTVEVGKRADQVLLNANPLENITNSQKIAGAMIHGHWLSKAEIQAWLEELITYYETLQK